MWQSVIVALIVVVASLYAIWKLLPVPARLRLARYLAAWSQRPGRPAWVALRGANLEASVRLQSGGCGGCGAVQSAPAPPHSKRAPPP